MSRTSRSTPPRTSNELPNSTDLVKRLEASKSALKARDLAELFGVTQQHIYKLAAKGSYLHFVLVLLFGLILRWSLIGSRR